jgi:hypothetical protein
MHELGWTMRDVTWRDRLDSLEEQVETLRRAADKAVFQLRTSEDEYARLVGERLSESMASFPAKSREMTSDELEASHETARRWGASNPATKSKPTPSSAKDLEFGESSPASRPDASEYIDTPNRSWENRKPS